MRLKEPLYGLRVAQLHFVMHVSMALTMIWLEAQFGPADYRNDVQYQGLLKQLCASRTGGHGNSGQPGNSDAGGPDTHRRLLAMREESTEKGFDPLGFYKRAYVHMTENEPLF